MCSCSYSLVLSCDYPSGFAADDRRFTAAGELELGTPMRVEGWMAKQGHVIKNWKNRWFVLEGRNIFYYTRCGTLFCNYHLHSLRC